MPKTEANHVTDAMLHYMDRCVELQANMTRIAQHDSFKKFNLHMANETPSRMLPILKELTDVCLAKSKSNADEESKKRREKNELIQEVAKRAKIMGVSKYHRNLESDPTVRPLSAQSDILILTYS